MAMEAYRGLLASFGQSIGLPELAPDEEGYCALSFDDLVVHLQHEPEDEEIAAFARIGAVDEDRALEIYEMLLNANQLWAGTAGATLSVQPEDRTVFIAARKPLEVLSDESFSDWLGDFVDITDYWTGRLARVNDGGPVDDPDDGGPVDDPDDNASEPDGSAPPAPSRDRPIILG
jgi:Tir chaperone protein (CesT) family